MPSENKHMCKAKDFSIPFNGDFTLLKNTLAAGRVMEIYFSIFDKVDLSANYYGASERPALKNEKATKLLSSMAKFYGVGLNLLCNSPSLYMSDLGKLFEKIHSIENLSAITISDPIALKAFLKEFPNLDIQASFIMNLNTYSKIEQFALMGGGTVIVPGAIHRNLKLLEKLKLLKTRYPKLRIKMIANLDCAPECIFLPTHYMVGMLSNVIKDSEKAYRNELCYRHFTPADFIKVPFIRPEDLSFYRKNEFADCFKLIYRSSPSESLSKVYNAYFSESYVGNLFDIVPSRCEAFEYAKDPNLPKDAKQNTPIFYCDNKAFPKDFIEKVISCDKDCTNCPYCLEIAEKTKTKMG